MVPNLEWLLQTPLLLPTSIEHQQRLATLLSAKEHEIKLLEKQRNALAKQKRGLMQKLLTGEWRVSLRDGDVDALAQRAAEAAE